MKFPKLLFRFNALGLQIRVHRNNQRLYLGSRTVAKTQKQVFLGPVFLLVS